MNSDLVIICGPSIGKTTRIMQTLALCQIAIATKVEGMKPIFDDLTEAAREQEHFAESLRNEIALSKASTEANLQQEFFRRESAYERRNRNAPWYRRFDRKRRR
jgi:hypothetical protein